MRQRRLGKIPWDLVVFLTVTGLGLGFSIRRAVNPEDRLSEMSEASISGSMGFLPAPRTLDLGCVEKRWREAMASADDSIRIRGKLCQLRGRYRKVFEGMHVQNLTNGYEGTVFFQGYDNSFVTDLVILKSGRNLIQIEWKEHPTTEPRVYVAEIFAK